MLSTLLFPLILRTKGVNNPICDVITRIVKEFLHPSHVSSSCQNLLCNYEEALKFTCLQDSVDQHVLRVSEFAEKYSNSLKFENCLLCFVNKRAPLLRLHKLLLTAVF